MNNEQIKQFVAERVAQGIPLSKIQDELTAQGVKITFMELRLIASEIDTEELEKLDKKAEVKKEEKAPEAAPAQAEMPAEEAVPAQTDVPAETPAEAPAEDAPRGPTVVEVSKLAMPGYALNGSVKFGSGVTADWYLDQMGRLALDKVEGGKPNEKDIEEFQLELRKALGA